MVNYDLPWNPMLLEQRIGRIDRIGQEHDVKIINFQLDKTVEQRVREVIEMKLEIIRTEFNDGEDKLADILSTLQDEFSFEDIYINVVDNIREAKLKELEQDRQAGRRELAQRQRFVPSLELLQAGYVEFEG